jgi:hypothetical protein
MLQLSAKIKASRTQIDAFREVIGTLQSFTVKFKKAKKLTAELLADLSASLTVFVDKANSMAAKIPSEGNEPE